MRISKCTAVVTGGASGLGEATVRNLVANGAKVAILDLDSEKGFKLAQELGGSAYFLETDITSTDSTKEALDKTVAVFGGLQIAVNCAGIVIAKKVLGKTGPHDLALFSKVIQVNLVGTFNVIRLVAEKMCDNDPNADDERGVIINTSSAAAFEGQIGQVAYSASKGGVASMTLPIARELAEWGIRVVTIAPGLFETPMLAGLPEPTRKALGKMVPFPPRLGRPSEFAQLVLQIVENSMLNGSTIRLDGAIRMQPK